MTKHGQKVSFGFIVSSTIEVIGYFITLIFAFNEIGLKQSTINLILICLIGVAIIAILNIAILGLNSFLPNFLAGISLWVANRVKRGSIIEIGEHKGEVTKVTLFEITLKNNREETIYIPNSLIFSKEFIVHPQALHHIMHSKHKNN